MQRRDALSEGFNALVLIPALKFIVRLLELHNALRKSLKSLLFLLCPPFPWGAGVEGAQPSGAGDATEPSAPQNCRPGSRCPYFAFSKKIPEGRLLLGLLNHLFCTNQSIPNNLLFQWSRV